MTLCVHYFVLFPSAVCSGRGRGEVGNGFLFLFRYVLVSFCLVWRVVVLLCVDFPVVDE